MKKSHKIYLIILTTTGVVVLFYFIFFTPKNDLLLDKTIFHNNNFLTTNNLKLDSINSIRIFDNLNQKVLEAETSFLQNKKGKFIYFYMNLWKITIHFEDEKITYDYRSIKPNNNNINNSLTQIESSYLKHLINIIEQNKNSLKNISTISIDVTLPEELHEFDVPISPFVGNASFNVDSLNASIIEKIDSEDFQ